MRGRNIGLAAAVTTLALGVGAVQLLPGAAPAAHASGLVGYDTCADLLEHYRQELERSADAYATGRDMPVAESSGAMPAAADAARSATQAVGNGPTGTNVQERGVDEPDVVKLRDGRLVVLTGTRLRVLSAEPQPRALGSLDLSAKDNAGGAGEVLLVGDRAVVVLSGWQQKAEPAPGSSRDGVWNPGVATTRLVLVDLDGGDPRLLEEATYGGQYVSARLVGRTVRLVTTTSPQIGFPGPFEPMASLPGGGAPLDLVNRFRAFARAVELRDVLPQVDRRDATGKVLDQGHAVSCGDTSYAPASRGAGTLLVTTMRPEDAGLAATDRKAVTTDGDLVYSSPDRLYVATGRWGTVSPVSTMAGARVVNDEVRTELHAFDTTSSTTTTYVGSGSVPGYVYGRWALSEHEGVLRVATTRQPPWDGQGGQERTSSMIVKLAERDGALVEMARVSGLGRTEHIKAVRYFGDLAAVVTFRQTDPLYLIDLGDRPRVLGELKIPGFSTYLHPVGEGLLLGLGQDATDQGQVTGMQVSVFDISDASAPRQVDRLSLGHGWSPALDDSRAFTYDPDRRLAAFVFAGSNPDGPKSQLSTAVGLQVAEDGSLTEAGRLELVPEAPAGRVLVDGSSLFAVGETGVVAGDAASWVRTGEVSFSDR